MEETIDIDNSAFIADGTKIVGKVTIKENSSVWYNCVIRADYKNTEVIIGNNTNIQDGSVVHLDHNDSAIIGNNVTVGHKCIIHGCTIGDGVLIGMGSILLNGAKIGENAIVAAGSLIKQGCIVEPNTLYAGIPAKKIRDLSNEQAQTGRRIAEDYMRLAKEHKSEKHMKYKF